MLTTTLALLLVAAIGVALHLIFNGLGSSLAPTSKLGLFLFYLTYVLSVVAVTAIVWFTAIGNNTAVSIGLELAGCASTLAGLLTIKLSRESEVKAWQGTLGELLVSLGILLLLAKYVLVPVVVSIF